MLRSRDVGVRAEAGQKPYLAIWMGGDADGALKRTARSLGLVPVPDQAGGHSARLDFIKSQPSFKGGPFEVSTASALAGRRGPCRDRRSQGRPGMSAQEIIDQLRLVRRARRDDELGGDPARPRARRVQTTTSNG